MRKTVLALLSVAALLGTAVPVIAHHAFAAEFDRDKPLSLEGTVTQMDWINPHAWLHFDVKDADGKVSNWAIELGAPNALIRRGFDRDSVPVGTKIIVKGFEAKDGGFRANGSSLTFADGRKMFVGSPGTGAPEEKP
jgi:hypothetical protein